MSSSYTNLTSQISNIEEEIKSSYNPFNRRRLKSEIASLKKKIASLQVQPDAFNKITYAELSSQISNIEKKIKSTYNPFTRRTLKKEIASLKVKRDALKNKTLNQSVHQSNITGPNNIAKMHMNAAKNQKLGINREEDRLQRINNAVKKVELSKINNKRYYFTRSNRVNTEKEKIVKP